jgi:RNA polymerase sigma-70 factor (ECF subfamily)
MSVCSRYERNKEDAEELLNLSFLKILMNLDKYKEETPLKLWMRRITINTIIDDFRKNKKMKEFTRTTDFSEEDYHHSSFDINDYMKKADAEDLLILINNLPDMSRSVFNMYVIDGFNHKEIADILGISDGTSRWYLNHAKTELKKNLLKPDTSNKFSA